MAERFLAKYKCSFAELVTRANVMKARPEIKAAPGPKAVSTGPALAGPMMQPPPAKALAEGPAEGPAMQPGDPAAPPPMSLPTPKFKVRSAVPQQFVPKQFATPKEPVQKKARPAAEKVGPPHEPKGPPPVHLQKQGPQALKYPPPRQVLASSSSSSSRPFVGVAPDEADRDEELAYLRRRLHNQYRAGRNKTYYAVLHKLGAEAARLFYVPKEVVAKYVGPAEGVYAQSATGPPLPTGPPPKGSATGPPPKASATGPPAKGSATGSSSDSGFIESL